MIPALADEREVSAIPAASPAAEPTVSDEHLRQLAIARADAKKVRRAVAVANFDGWTIGAFGLLTLLFGITDPTSIIMGIAMCAIAWIELRGAAAVRRLDERAAKTLGVNQLALASLLIGYSLWRIYAVSTGAGPYDAFKASDPAMAHMLQPIEDVTRLISLALYGILIFIAVFAQGGLALYYFSRARHIEAYRQRTPDWIIKLQQAGMGV